MSQTSEQTTIRFASTSVVYPNGVCGLDGLDLKVEKGRFVVIVGLSGAGKSTLLRAVNGLVEITSGDILVEGRSVRLAQGSELRRLRARIGMIFQDCRLIRQLTVLQNVLIGRIAEVPIWRAVADLWPKEDLEIAFDALERVGIADYAYLKAAWLSGGQQQRVGIARALAQQPGVILADDPEASLDPVSCHQVLHDLQQISRDLGITTVVNLHYLDLAKTYGERIVGLRQGKLVFDGEGDKVTERDFVEIYGRSIIATDLLASRTL